MKKLFLIAGIAVMSCCSAKKTADSGNNTNSDSVTVISITEKDFESDTNLPLCIKKLIRQFKQEEKKNPPRAVYSYTYNGKLVFYVPAICCDFFSDLYDDKCNLIAHPDGGFTGRGDGKAPDFIQARTGEKLIWKDLR